MISTNRCISGVNGVQVMYIYIHIIFRYLYIYMYFYSFTSRETSTEFPDVFTYVDVCCGHNLMPTWFDVTTKWKFNSRPMKIYH